MRRAAAYLAIVALGLAGCVPAPQILPDGNRPAQAVLAVQAQHLDPEFWIRRLQAADRSVLDTAAIAAQNARLQQLDPSLHDIEALPAMLPAALVTEWIGKLSRRPDTPRFDEQGQELAASTLDSFVDNLGLDDIQDMRPARYGLVVRRADLRTFPTRRRVFSSRDDMDIDRFQESALFPGTPVVIAHESRDRQWWFVVSATYAAWIEKDSVATGSPQRVLDYVRKTPYLVVTGSTVRTVFTREQPQVSALQLDMGVRVPVVTDWPANQTVNGQHPYTAHVIELPIRTAAGTLDFTPALLPKTADVAADYLTLSRAHLLQQSFKFLGERYGWGHSYNARDCSGFVSEIYRSFGVQLPRNTRDQGVSPALDRIAFTAADTHAARLAVLRNLQVGDLVYIPGHVMMVIGHDHGIPYVIHDTAGIGYRNDAGELVHVKLNGVSVTALTPLVLGDGRPMIDTIYSIQRMRPPRKP